MLESIKVHSQLGARSFSNTERVYFCLPSKELTFLKTKAPFAFRTGESTGVKALGCHFTEARWQGRFQQQVLLQIDSLGVQTEI